MRTKRLPVALLAVMGAILITPTSQAQTIHYAVLSEGKKIGHALWSRHVSQGKVITEERSVITIARMGQSLTVHQSDKSIETTDGKPVGFETSSRLGMETQNTSGKVGPDGVVTIHASGAAGKKTTTIPWPAGAVMSEGFRLLSLSKGLKEGTVYTAKVFIPSLEMATTMSVTVAGKKKVDLLGRVVALTEVKTDMKFSMADISSVNYVDADHRSLKTVSNVMGIPVEIVACDKSVALSPNDVVDFFDKMLLQSPAPLSDLKEAKSATYHLKPKPGKELSRMVTTDSQTVAKGKDGHLIVTVKPTRLPASAAPLDKKKDPSVAEATKPTKYLQSDHPTIIALASKAVGSEKDPARASKLIEAFVGKYVTAKNLSVGYASAVEVAGSKEGDCTEHAVLASAMSRAVGIPARVVVGYVYVPSLGSRKDVFGGHAWLEVYVAGKWVGLDPLRGGVSPGHIAQAVGNGDPSDFFGAVNTMGSFTIEKVLLQR